MHQNDLIFERDTFKPKKNIWHLIYALSLLRGVYLILRKTLNPNALDHRIEGHHCCLESGLMRSCHHHLSRQWASHSFPARPNGPAGLYRRRWSPPVGEKKRQNGSRKQRWRTGQRVMEWQDWFPYHPWLPGISKYIWLFFNGTNMETSVNIPYHTWMVWVFQIDWQDRSDR